MRTVVTTHTRSHSLRNLEATSNLLQGCARRSEKLGMVLKATQPPAAKPDSETQVAANRFSPVWLAFPSPPCLSVRIFIRFTFARIFPEMSEIVWNDL